MSETRRTLAIEKAVVGLPEGLLRRSTKKFTPFCSVVLNAPFCPVKQKLRRNECEVSMVKIPQHKVTKWGKFFSASFFGFLSNPTKHLYGDVQYSFNNYYLKLERFKRVFNTPRLKSQICLLYCSVGVSFACGKSLFAMGKYRIQNKYCIFCEYVI